MFNSNNNINSIIIVTSWYPRLTILILLFNIITSFTITIYELLQYIFYVFIEYIFPTKIISAFL